MDQGQDAVRERAKDEKRSRRGLRRVGRGGIARSPRVYIEMMHA